MSFIRLPESVQTLYAELLDQLRAADAEAALGGMRGSFVSKEIRGRTYWYLQKSEGATKRQIYLGRESPELLDRIRISAKQQSSAAPDENRRRELVAMLATGGMFRDSAASATVLRVLAEASVFRAGGVLVGTQAFSCLANMLGVSFEKESLRTADIDVAYDTAVPVGLDEQPDAAGLLLRLRATEPAFFAIPGLDPRDASTSFKVRGRDLRVDFLTPDKSHGKTRKPVFLPHLGIAAQPLYGLDYLIDEAVDGAVIGGSGIRVNVPSPGRFAFHKLWVAGARPPSEAVKSRKDLRQATQMIEVLIDDRPNDIAAAYEALARRPRMFRSVRARLRSLDSSLTSRLGPLLMDTTLGRA
ncbi:MAG: GSU2403 family nucleotidyltransferase fold protein [Acidobacteriota bacterium]|nr:GSU2403 family nucleotidyltransferase fold protein [Acidobacteriota bacterium]